MANFLAPAKRRRAAAAVLGALVVGSLTFAGTLALVPEAPDPLCGTPGRVLHVDFGPLACAHADPAPPGVDIREPISTADLKARPGAGPNALEAAEDLGLASAPASTGTSPDVTCDGDGTAGYRTQAMYVVEAGATNRYASMKSTLQNWAAGVDDVVNRSAALTGGVRHLRYVTEAGGGGCVASVLNVTVPAGSLSTFGASINAVRALGYDSTARKYLLWTDTSGKGICGIALTYPYDTDGQGNPNNGSYAQYSRIDSPCWGLGNGDYEHSIEAHELLHTLGAVMSTAPHGTRAGHCWDESDTMCYSDGGGFAMKQVCPQTREYLLDCNSDDYFSTYPDPGSWLDTHWNAADSRFLIGGGNGAGGGTAGTPTVLGATIGVNNPAVPGLATQVSVTAALPTGRTLASVSWKSARADCTFSTPTLPQSDVTCAATAATATTVTATLTDSSGAKKIISSPLTFTLNTSRPVTADLAIAAQSAADVGSASVCTGAATPVVVRLTDTTTGQPIKGLVATLTKQATGSTTVANLALTPTKVDGTTTVSQSLTIPASFTAKAALTKVYAAAAPVSLGTTVGKCAPVLTAATSTLASWYGDPVTVSGTLTRDVAGVDVPVSGAGLPVTLTTTSVVLGKTVTKVTTIGSAKTLADGSYTLVVKPTFSGALKIALPASTAYNAASVQLGDLVVTTPTTTLTGAVDRADVAYGQTVTVTGALTKQVDTSVGVAGASVLVKVTPAGKSPVTVATGRTTADGSYSIPAVLKISGPLSVVFAGLPGLPAATRSVAPVTATNWVATLVTPTATPSGVLPGLLSTLTGSVTRAFGGVSEPAKSLSLKVTVQPTGGTATTAYVRTTATGTYLLKVYPKVTTTYTVRVVGVLGYDDATASPVTVTVSGP